MSSRKRQRKKIKQEEPSRKSKIKQEKPQDFRTKEYECYKISTKKDCEEEESCMWDNSWWNVLFKNKCKSRLFHDLKINYPAKAKDYQKIVDTLKVLEGKKTPLTKKEQMDLSILQEFRDDYVLFDANTKNQAMNIYILEKLYESETDLAKKREIMKEIKKLRKTALQYIKETLLQKEVLYALFASALIAYFGPMTVVNMSKEIFSSGLGFIKDALGIYSIEEQNQILKMYIQKNQSAIDLVNATTAGTNATAGLVDATGIGYVLKVFSGWVNPTVTLPLVAAESTGKLADATGKLGHNFKSVWTFFTGNKDGKVRSRNSKIKKKK